MIAVKPNAASVGAAENDASIVNSRKIRSASKHHLLRNCRKRSCTGVKRCARRRCGGRRYRVVNSRGICSASRSLFPKISPLGRARENPLRSRPLPRSREVSDDVEPTVRVGELTDNARLPMMLLLYLALGLAVVGILSFAFRKLFKNETNKMVAGADVTEIARSMALRLGRGRDSNGETGDLQQADAFVLNEVGCARDIEQPDQGTAPTPISHDQLPRAKLTFNEYRQ